MSVSTEPPPWIRNRRREIAGLHLPVHVHIHGVVGAVRDDGAHAVAPTVDILMVGIPGSGLREQAAIIHGDLGRIIVQWGGPDRLLREICSALEVTP